MSSQMFNRFMQFPKNHETLTASNTVDFSREMLILAGTAGTMAVVDWKDTVITYTVEPGDIIPILAKRVNSTGTTVTQIIGLY